MEELPMIDDLFGYFEGGRFIHLNWALSERQNLTDDERQLIIECHDRRVVIFDKMSVTDDVKRLRQYADEIEELEFELQRHWHFPIDHSYHTWWIKAPGCTCPKMDNKDPMYNGLRIISSGCKLHGKDFE